MEELNCELLALTTYREVPDISERESELAVEMSLIEGYLEHIRRPERKDYRKAYGDISGYLVRNGVLRIEGGTFTWDNIQDIFESLNEMHREVDNIFLHGKARDAQAFHHRNFNPELYDYLITKQSYPVIPQES